MLALAKLAVKIFPSERVLAFAERPPTRVNRFADQSEIASTSAAVEHVGAKRWMSAACLPRALASQAMLRRRGIASRLVLGVNREGGEMAAHAWLERDRDIVVGGAEALQFSRLAEFGGR